MDPLIKRGLPFFNEAPQIISGVNNNLTVICPKGQSFEIIIVDDASNDGSAKVVSDFCIANPHLSILLREV